MNEPLVNRLVMLLRNKGQQDILKKISEYKVFIIKTSYSLENTVAWVFLYNRAWKIFEEDRGKGIQS